MNNFEAFTLATICQTAAVKLLMKLSFTLHKILNLSLEGGPFTFLMLKISVAARLCGIAKAKVVVFHVSKRYLYCYIVKNYEPFIYCNITI